jgi:ABC-2 type transport system permease protein
VKPYIAMFKMKLIAGMQYRAAAWAGIATQFFWGLMLLMIYRAFYSSSGAEPPMSWNQMVAYQWLNQSFFAIIMLWAVDGDLMDGITNGHVAYELCRPYDLYSFWFVRLAGWRLSVFILRCLPILIGVFIIPEPYRMTLPANITSFCAFVLSMSLSLLLVTAISMFMYILTFTTMSSYGSRLVTGIAAEFLAGQIIAIPLMPEWMQRVLDFLPYRYVSDLPFRLYSGNINGADAAFQIGVQIVWILGLCIIGKAAFGRTMRKIVIQGG